MRFSENFIRGVRWGRPVRNAFSFACAEVEALEVVRAESFENGRAAVITQVPQTRVKRKMDDPANNPTPV